MIFMYTDMRLGQVITLLLVNLPLKVNLKHSYNKILNHFCSKKKKNTQFYNRHFDVHPYISMNKLYKL